MNFLKNSNFDEKVLGKKKKKKIMKLTGWETW